MLHAATSLFHIPINNKGDGLNNNLLFQKEKYCLHVLQEKITGHCFLLSGEQI